MRTRCLAAALAVSVLSATTVAQAPRPDAAFWDALTAICGKAFAGRMVEGTEPSDKAMGDARLVMHVRTCSAAEIRVPFHVGDNRSRTWVLTRTPGGLRLKHDHRHEDGSPDAVTQYGGDATVTPGALAIDFPADAFTATMLPAAATNIWTMSLVPGKAFTYALRREAQGRRFRVEFDLSKPVAAPAAPWQ